MQQEIQSAGVRANAICGAEAETHVLEDARRASHPSRISLETNEERIQRLINTASLRMCQAYAILTKAYEPAYTIAVDDDICSGVEFLCRAGIRDCEELISLNIFEFELSKQILTSAVALMGLSDGELSIDQAFGLSMLIGDAHREFNEGVHRRARAIQ